MIKKKKEFSRNLTAAAFAVFYVILNYIANLENSRSIEYDLSSDIKVIFLAMLLSGLRVFFDKGYYNSFKNFIKQHIIVDIIPYTVGALSFFPFSSNIFETLEYSNYIFFSILLASIFANFVYLTLSKYLYCKSKINIRKFLFLLTVNTVCCIIFWIGSMYFIAGLNITIGVVLIVIYSNTKLVQDYIMINECQNAFRKISILYLIPTLIFITGVTTLFLKSDPKGAGVTIVIFSLIYGLSLIVSIILNFILINFKNLKTNE